MVRRLLLVIPVVVALTLVSLFMPAQRLSIEGIGKLSFETTVTLSVGSEVALAAPGTKTLYFENASLFPKVWRLSETAPSVADELTSVKSGKAAVNTYFAFVPRVTDNAASGAAFIEGDAEGAHGWRSQNKYSGSFASGNWTIAYKLKNSHPSTNAGRIYARIYRTSVDDPTTAQLFKMNSVDGFSAIISFSGTPHEVMTGSFTVNCDQNLTLNNEYVFIILNWLVTTPGSNVNSGVKLVVNEGAAEKVDTTEWTPAPPDISVDPTEKDFGVVAASSTPNTGNAYFTITNSSTMTIDINIKCNGWSPASPPGSSWTYGSPIGEDQGFLAASSANGGAGGSGGQGLYDIEILNGADSLLCDDVATTTNPTWELQLNAPSSFTHGDEQRTTVTLTASAS